MIVMLVSIEVLVIDWGQNAIAMTFCITGVPKNALITTKEESCLILVIFAIPIQLTITAVGWEYAMEMENLVCALKPTASGVNVAKFGMLISAIPLPHQTSHQR